MIEPEQNTVKDEEPLFNIGIVSRMNNINEATLRIWERRYDFPRPARSTGGHRLYSQHEIIRLKWVTLRVKEGMRASKAIQALIRMEQEGGMLTVATSDEPSTTRTVDDASLPVFHRRLMEALIGHDAEAANKILAETVSLFSSERIIYDLISPTLFDIGVAWQNGEIDVATEHFATNLLRNNLYMWMRTSPPSFHVNPVILACAPGELHEGSLLMIGLLLQRLRWPIIYLGQSMPLSSFASIVNVVQPSIIVFVAMTEQTALELLHWPDYLPQTAQTGRPVVGYGGRAFIEHPALAGQIPGVLLGKTLQEGIEKLNGLLHDLNPLLR